LFYPERDAQPAVNRELNGREGALRHGNDAGRMIASLWSVHDLSTALLANR
jgi:hypothetical protein